jgi:hypothetical protein
MPEQTIADFARENGPVLGDAAIGLANDVWTNSGRMS